MLQVYKAASLVNAGENSERFSRLIVLADASLDINLYQLMGRSKIKQALAHWIANQFKFQDAKEITRSVRRKVNVRVWMIARVFAGRKVVQGIDLQDSVNA